MAKVEVNQVNNLDPNSPEGQEALNKKIEDLKKDGNINKPSREECDAFKQDFEDMGNTFAITRWGVGSAKDGNKIIDYLRHYSRERHMWKSNEWMGIIKLQEELDTVEKAYELSAKKEPVNFPYQAIEFLFHMLQNPGGMGYQAALDFESENELYAEVFDAVGATLQDARAALKELDFAQQKWQAAEQGFYLEMDEPEAKESEGGEENGIYFDEELGRDVKPGEPEYKIEKFQKFMHAKYGGLKDPLSQEKEEEPQQSN